MNLLAGFMQTIFRWSRFKEKVLRDFKDPPRGTPVMDPDRYPDRLHPTAWKVEGCRMLTLTSNQPGSKQLLFLPGGAYLLEATPFHGSLARKLVEQTNYPVTMVEYPKAPHYTYQAAQSMVRKAFLKIAEKNPEKELYLLGDSAGGGLGLALLQSLRADGKDDRIGGTVLISPWVDLTLTNPEIKNYVEQDHFLPLEGLQYAAECYSGGEDLSDPQLSPLYGDLSHLGRILLFCGTGELLFPDCQRLQRELHAAEGSQVEFHVGEGLFHDWVIFPLPASQKALRRIIKFLRDS